MRNLRLSVLAALAVMAGGIPAAAVASESKKTYIVTGATAQGIDAQPQHIYPNGFAAELTDGQVKQLKGKGAIVIVDSQLQLDRRSVEEASVSRLSSQITPTGVSRIGGSVAAGGVGVAVMDSGIAQVRDLRSQLAKKGSKSFVASEPNAYSDGLGHGTHVAGTIAATNNTLGVVGVNPAATLFSVKIFDSQGNAQWSDIIAATYYLADNARRLNIRVVNMSFTGPGDYAPFRQALSALANAGVTIVVASGNNGQNASGFNPAGYDESVITVSALSDYDGAPGSGDAIAPWANFGASVDCAAPGDNILSTGADGGYWTMSGTSMASPHVAGLASRMLAANPALSWTQVRSTLLAQSEPVGSGHTDPTGFGTPVCVG